MAHASWTRIVRAPVWEESSPLASYFMKTMIVPGTTSAAWTWKTNLACWILFLELLVAPRYLDSVKMPLFRITLPRGTTVTFTFRLGCSTCHLSCVASHMGCATSRMGVKRLNWGIAYCLVWRCILPTFFHKLFQVLLPFAAAARLLSRMVVAWTRVCLWGYGGSGRSGLRTSWKPWTSGSDLQITLFVSS